jgi:hypothetical protein
MGSFFSKRGARIRVSWLWRSLRKALALNLYEVRSDGLLIEQSSFRLAISWRARHVHPWDRHMAIAQRTKRWVEQTFSDTQRALERLFEALPEIEVIDFDVLQAEPQNDGILLRGSVSRNEFEAWRPSSIPMRFRLLGIEYNLANSTLEPIEDEVHETAQYQHSGRGGSTNGPGVRPTQAWYHDKAGRP